MTDLQILEAVIRDLDEIKVPSKYIEEIGIPIANSSNRLKALLRAIIANAKEKAEAEAAKEEEEVNETEQQNV